PLLVQRGAQSLPSQGTQVRSFDEELDREVILTLGASVQEGVTDRALKERLAQHHPIVPWRDLDRECHHVQREEANGANLQGMVCCPLLQHHRHCSPTLRWMVILKLFTRIACSLQDCSLSAVRTVSGQLAALLAA